MSSGRSPDYKVGGFDRQTGIRGNLGVAWKNPDGTISIKLNMCTLIDTGQQDLVITLFPMHMSAAEIREQGTNHKEGQNRDRRS